MMTTRLVVRTIRRWTATTMLSGSILVASSDIRPVRADDRGASASASTSASASASAPTSAQSSDGAASREQLQGPKLDALLAEIAAARKNVKTMRANFVQERKMTLLATTVKSTGQLSFVAPDRLRWELGAPDDVVYWIGPEGLSFRTRSSKATMPATGANVVRGLSDLRALLGGDLATLKERYDLSASRGANDVTVTGTAREKNAPVRGFTLELDKTLVVPTRAHLREGKADTVDITFSNGVVNVPIEPRSMRP